MALADLDERSDHALMVSLGYMDNFIAGVKAARPIALMLLARGVLENRDV